MKKKKIYKRQRQQVGDVFIVTKVLFEDPTLHLQFWFFGRKSNLNQKIYFNFIYLIST